MFKRVLDCKFYVLTKAILMFVFMILCKSSVQKETIFDDPDIPIVTDEDDYFASDRDDKLLEKKDKSFCEEANLRIGTNPNLVAKTLTVNFALTDLRFKGCFKYYKIALKRKHKTVQENTIPYIYDEDKDEVSHEFLNVTCGFYDVVIKLCKTDWQCIRRDIVYTNASMNSSDCYGSKPARNKSNANIKIEIVVMILAVVSVISSLFVAGFIRYYCLSDRFKGWKDGVIYWPVNNPKGKIPGKNIRIYIFHRFNKILKKEVNKILRMLKFQKSFDQFILSVKGIEEELSSIHFSENIWFQKVLKERNTDGTFNKIILIDSDMNFEDETFENENFIFSEIVKRLTADTSRCLTGYDSLFVAHIGGNVIHPQTFQNVVRRQRYRIPIHLNELYQNLCSVSE